jgi:hypothetical protein
MQRARPVNKAKQNPTPDPHEQVGSCADNEGRDEELRQEDGSKPVIINGQFWFKDWGGDEEK